MGRIGLIMAAVAFVAVALMSLIPLLGAVVVGPLVAALIGAGAGWWVSKVLGYGTAGRGAAAGAIAGIGALFGSVVGLAVLGSLLGNSAEFQQQLQRQLEDAAQQNPGATLPDVDAGAAGTLASLGLGVLGFCVGLFDLLLSTIGGLIAGVVYGRNRGPVPVAGGYPGDQTGLPRMTNTAESDQDRGARIYPDNQ